MSLFSVLSFATCGRVIQYKHLFDRIALLDKMEALLRKIIWKTAFGNKIIMIYEGRILRASY